MLRTFRQRRFVTYTPPLNPLTLLLWLVSLLFVTGVTTIFIASAAVAKLPSASCDGATAAFSVVNTACRQEYAMIASVLLSALLLLLACALFVIPALRYRGETENVSRDQFNKRFCQADFTSWLTTSARG